MAAALLWARSSLRSRWRSAAIVALIAGLCGAVGMASIAGARRTSTSFSRFVRDSKEPQVYVAAPDQETGHLAADVMRRIVDPDLVAEAVYFAAAPSKTATSKQTDLSVVGILTDTVDRTLMFPKIIDGAVPTGNDEIAINDAAATEFGVGSGDQLHMRGYSPPMQEACFSGAGECVADVDLGAVTVSGILRRPEDVSPESFGALNMQLSVPLTMSWLPLVGTQVWIAAARVDSAEMRAALDTTLTEAIGATRLTGGEADVFLETNGEADPDRVDSALDVERNGLLILALLAILAGVIAVPQALARDREWSSMEHSRLRELGWTRRDQLRAGAIWSAAQGVAAGAIATIGAIALSPLFPIGLARSAEPSVGIDADWVVLTIGATLTVLAVLGAALLVSFGRARTASRTPSRLARMIAASRPVPSTAGRFLLDGDRVSTATRTALSAAVVGIAIIACAATVVRSQDFLIARPELYGAPWDLQGVVGGQPDAASLAALNADPGVAASAVLTGGRVEADGDAISAVGVEQLKGSIEPTILSGRMIQRDGEVLLSRQLMEGHGLAVGDSVSMGSPPSGSLTIVGLAVPITVGTYGSDVGAVMTQHDYDAYANPVAIEGEGGVEVAVRLEPGADGTSVRNLLAQITGGFDRVISESYRPAHITNFARVRSVPQIITGFAALLTLLVLIHSLAMVAGRKRHDLGVLRALGMQRRQAHLVMWCHGAMLALLAIVLGLPLGIVGGRLLWKVIARSIESVNVPQVPWTALASFGCGLTALSIAAGAVVARRAVPRSLAALLRSE